MGSDVMSQPEAWQVYDKWLDDPRVLFLDEPSGLEQAFRAHSRRRSPAPKEWADSYLLAFAEEFDLKLVTFDQGFGARSKNIVLLKG
jgi:predicted nucleic acid-binding protein